MDKSATHPSGLEINFNEAAHKYTDSLGRVYTSVTTLVHQYTQPFDTAKISKAYAQKHGMDPKDVVAMWDAERDRSCEQGTATHLMLENYINTGDTTGMSDRAKPGVEIIDAIKLRGFDITSEKMIFSPSSKIAGTIDFIGTKAGSVVLLDWKTNKEIKTKGFKGAKMRAPFDELDDCNLNHYTLQLSIYECLLRNEGYVAPDVKCERILIHMTGTEAVVIAVPYLGDLAQRVINYSS